MGIDSKEAGTRLSYRLYEELTTRSLSTSFHLVDDDLKQLAMARIRDDQISIPVEDDPLRIDQPVDQDDIFLVLRCDHMDGIIANGHHKDIPVRILDYIIRNGQTGNLFEGTIRMQANDCIAIFIRDQQIAVRFSPRSSWARQS